MKLFAIYHTILFAIYDATLKNIMYNINWISQFYETIVKNFIIITYSNKYSDLLAVTKPFVINYHVMNMQSLY